MDSASFRLRQLTLRDLVKYLVGGDLDVKIERLELKFQGHPEKVVLASGQFQIQPDTPKDPL